MKSDLLKRINVYSFELHTSEPKFLSNVSHYLYVSAASASAIIVASKVFELLLLNTDDTLLFTCDLFPVFLL